MEHCRHINLCIVYMHAKMTVVSEQTSLCKHNLPFKLYVMHFCVFVGFWMNVFVRGDIGNVFKITTGGEILFQNRVHARNLFLEA